MFVQRAVCIALVDFFSKRLLSTGVLFFNVYLLSLFAFGFEKLLIIQAKSWTQVLFCGLYL